MTTTCFTGSAGVARFIPDYKASTLAVDAKASPPHSFTVTAEEFETEIEIDPDSLVPTSAVCRFRFDDMDSEKKKRDAKMRKWIESDTYPSATFTLREVRANPDGTGRLAVGDFQMHGQTRSVSFPFSVQRKGDRVVIEGRAAMDYTQWDLPIVRLLFFKVKKDIQPHLHLEGRLVTKN